MNRTRWKSRVLSGLLTLGLLGGCKQQVFLPPGDLEAGLSNVKLAKLESEPTITTHPQLTPGQAPATVLDPSRPARPITLKEAIAIMLEQGTEGSQALNGSANNSLTRSSARGGASDIDTLSAFALNPAIAEAEIERSLSKFDARWITSMTWNKVDQPTLSLQQSFSNGDSANLSSTLAKPLPTGGVAGITFNTRYLSLSTPPANRQFVTLPTSYTPQVQFIFEQPLMQSFGVEINQLLGSHPGSFLIQGLRPSGGQGSEGILVTRIRSTQAKADFCRTMNNALLNLERAYWNLYTAYYSLAAQEEGLKQSLDGYLFFRARAASGQDRPQVGYQYRAEYELFRSRVIEARGVVLNAEQQLRGILGMRSDDGTRLVPVDDPVMTPFVPDYNLLAQEALQSRPELTIARQEVKARQLDLILQRNLRRPDARFISSYDISALGRQLNGRGPNVNAFRDLADNNFNSWQVGVRLDMPIGFRDANALTRQATLNLWRSYYQLNDSERKTLEFLTEQYRAVLQTYEVIKSRRAQRQALEEFVRLENTRREVGAITGNEIANIIRSQRDLADAIAAEYQSIANYNNALAGLEYAKGTIQEYNNVTLAEGPLPPHVQKKAADHFKAREAALKLREHPDSMPLPALYEWKPTQDIGMPANQAAMPPLNQPGSALPPPAILSAPASSGTGSPMSAPASSGTGSPMSVPPAVSGTPMPMTMTKTAPTAVSTPVTSASPRPGAWSPGSPAFEPTAPVVERPFEPIGTVQLPKRSGQFEAVKPPESDAPVPTNTTSVPPGNVSIPMTLPPPPTQ